MRGFEANDCRLCKKTFCCPECRLKHEIKIHKIFPGCNLCIYGQSECEDVIKETQFEHLEKTHLPLNCIYCRRVFASVEEIRQHRKCPVIQKRDDLPKTPFKEALFCDADEEEAQDSPILQELQRNELLSYKFDLATSTPMPRVQEPVSFDKNRKSDIQFDKSIPVINKSIIRKTDSRVDSIKDDDHSSKRRVTFVETPGNIEKMDPGRREDKRENTPEYAKEKTCCSPVTPATGIRSDQFYSAQSELDDFLPTRATAFSRHRQPAEGCTPVGVSFLSKVIPAAKENISELSDYHAPNESQERHDGPKDDEDINTDEVPMDFTCEDEETGKITTETSIVGNSNRPDEQPESSQADQHTSLEKMRSNIISESADATGINEKFDTPNSDFNKVSSTPGFIRRRGLLSERFPPEVPQIQFDITAPENASIDLEAPNMSVQKGHEQMNKSDVSMEFDCSWVTGKVEPIVICSPLSASVLPKSSSSCSSSTKIIEESNKGDDNLSKSDFENNEKCESPKADQQNSPVDVDNEMKMTMDESINENNNEAIHNTKTDDISRSMEVSCSSGVSGHPSGKKETTSPTNQDAYTAARPYTCDFCSRRFRIKANLNNHMAAHHAGRTHSCNLCGVRYTRKADLSIHLESYAHVSEEVVTMHGNIVEEPPAVDVNKEMNGSFKTLAALNSAGILGDITNTENDENTPPNVKTPCLKSWEILYAPAKSSKPRSLKNNGDCEFSKERKPPVNVNNEMNDISSKMLWLKSAGVLGDITNTENDENTPPAMKNPNQKSKETPHAPAKSSKSRSLKNDEEFSQVDQHTHTVDVNKEINDISSKTLRLKRTDILDDLNNIENDENPPPNNKVPSQHKKETIDAVAKTSNSRISKNNEECEFSIADQHNPPVNANKQIHYVSLKMLGLKSASILDDFNNAENYENTPPNMKIPSQKITETLHASAKSSKPRNLKENGECESFESDEHYNSPVDANKQPKMIMMESLNEDNNESQLYTQTENIFIERLRLKIAENDKNSPPDIKVPREENNKALDAPAKSSKPRCLINNEECESSEADQPDLSEEENKQINDFSSKALQLKSATNLDDLNNVENTLADTEFPSQKNIETRQASAEFCEVIVTTSMPTDVPTSFNVPNHFASTPIIHKFIKIKQINITEEISKIPKDLLSSKSDSSSLPNNYSSAETNECKDLAICDSIPENNQSSEGCVTVSSMTDLSLWTSVTRIFQTVFGGLHSRNKDKVMDTSIFNFNRMSFKRPLSESDSDTNYSSPHVKRYKFSDIKCRRPIRDPLELPVRVARSCDRVATSGIVRTVYEAGPRCKIMWDKATQTDDYLMIGWHPQLK